MSGPWRSFDDIPDDERGTVFDSTHVIEIADELPDEPAQPVIEDDDPLKS